MTASPWRQEQFLSARSTMADGEAIGLSLDLADSVLVIELGGVPLRRCDLRDLHVSPSLYRHPRAVATNDGLPMLFSLERAEATIPKVPVRVVEAPRDTAEANARPPQERPVETRAAHVVLHFTEGLTLHISPEPSGTGSALRGSLLLARERVAEGARAVRTVAQGGVPAPRMWVEVVLSPEDARAVYRALPAEAPLALRLP